MQGHDDSIKKSKERLITTANKRISKISTNRKKKQQQLGNRNGKKNNLLDILSDNWWDCIRENLDMTKKGKSQEKENLFKSSPE